MHILGILEDQPLSMSQPAAVRLLIADLADENAPVDGTHAFVCVMTVLGCNQGAWDPCPLNGQYLNRPTEATQHAKPALNTPKQPTK